MRNQLQLNIEPDLAWSGNTAPTQGPQPWAGTAQRGITALQVISGRSAGRTGSAPAVDEIDAYARHALAANGFGDALVGDHQPNLTPTSGRPPQGARGHFLGRLYVAVERSLRDIGTALRQARVRAEHRRQAADVYLALRALDTHTLRDLGFDRSELPSVAADAAGEIIAARARFIQAPHCLGV